MDQNKPLTIRRVIQQSFSKRSIADTISTFFATNTPRVVMDHRADIIFFLKCSFITFADSTNPDPGTRHWSGL